MGTGKERKVKSEQLSSQTFKTDNEVGAETEEREKPHARMRRRRLNVCRKINGRYSRTLGGFEVIAWHRAKP